MDLWRRATRTAEATPLGEGLARFFSSADIEQLLVEAAQRGDPPVSAVSAELIQKLPGITTDAQAKRTVGLFVSAVLAKHGYSPTRSHVRLRDPLFTTGSEYGKQDVAPAEPDSFLQRFAAALSAEEAATLVACIAERFPKIKLPTRK